MLLQRKIERTGERLNTPVTIPVNPTVITTSPVTAHVSPSVSKDTCVAIGKNHTNTTCDITSETTKALPQFFKIAREFSKSKQALMLFIASECMSDANGECFFNQTIFAKTINVTREHVGKMLIQLKRAQILSVFPMRMGDMRGCKTFLSSHYKQDIYTWATVLSQKLVTVEDTGANPSRLERQKEESNCLLRIKPDTEEVTSRQLLKITEDEIAQDYPNLFKIGFGVKQIMQLTKSLAKENLKYLKSSFEYADYELETCKGNLKTPNGEHVRKPLDYIFTIFKNGGSYPEPKGFIPRTQREQNRTRWERRWKILEPHFYKWLACQPESDLIRLWATPSDYHSTPENLREKHIEKYWFDHILTPDTDPTRYDPTLRDPEKIARELARNSKKEALP